MNSRQSETFLHWWASITVVIMGFALIIPKNIMPATEALPIWIRIIGGILGAIVVAFYFRMFYECLFRRAMRRKALWVVFFIAMPVFSSIVYFMTMRSELYWSPVPPSDR